MKAKPLQWISPPAYPTRTELLTDGQQLARHVPRGWRRGSKLANAASMLIAANLTGFVDAGPRPIKFVGTPPAAAAAQATAGADAVAATIVAPVFEHGTGRGVTGCVVVSPPVFLSEEDAIQIIKEELHRAGLELESGTTLEDVAVAPRYNQQVRGTNKSQVVQDSDKAKPLAVDGRDSRKNVVIEYVSLRQYEADGGVNTGRGRYVDEDGRSEGWYRSTVSSYDFKDAAKYLSSEIAKQGKQKRYVGVFYDPLVKMGRLEPVDGNGEAKRLLRQQARDFVAWLSKQGAI
jgi:hypothetical protein